MARLLIAGLKPKRLVEIGTSLLPLAHLDRQLAKGQKLIQLIFGHLSNSPNNLSAAHTSPW